MRQKLRLLQLRSCQITLLSSLAFSAVLAVFSAPLTAQTTQDLPKRIPNLSGYDSETRQTIEIACVSERVNGPAAYGACLNRQIASLQTPRPAGGSDHLAGNLSRRARREGPLSAASLSDI